ncbi:hypothetical protein D6C78_06428 [Aureobasidium pullulans]|uniref:beta-glucosidase n=1 Tax=Aureobasidium pullulans TaxID=5580 RepID=A0A4T0BKK7_AURPU|nr:hypothetical protein D6C78_06428 [Aureobasidium pullulans]
MVGTIARLFTVLLVVFVSSLISAGASSSMLSSSLPSRSSLLVLPSTTVPTLPQVTSQLAASLSTALPPAARGIPNLENAIVQAVITAYNQAAASFLKAINPEYFYSYGRSPPVYPTPQVSGAGPWAKSYSRAKGMVSKLTNVQKNSILYGASDSRNCSGFISAISSIGFPGLCFNDAESGVRGTIRANGYPA